MDQNQYNSNLYNSDTQGNNLIRNNQSFQNNQILGYNPQTGQPIYSNNNYNLNQYNNYNSNNNKKIKIILFIIIGLVLILLVSSIFLINNNKTLSRTIMIYMVGADLESKNGLATVDLNGINYDLMDNKNVNVVLIAGGAKKWNNNFISLNETSIYELKNNGFEKVKTQTLKNMGDSKVFSEFLNYVYNNYKTDEYDLIFWNHGASIMGAEIDEITGDLLTLNDLKIGLSNSKFNKTNKLESIIFRTCLNGTIEVANVFKDYADYLVASEEITRGASIDNVLGFINDIKATDNSYNFNIKFIESYKDQISSIKSLYKIGYEEAVDIYSTYSIIDLSKVGKLENSVNEFFSSIDVTSNYNKIAKVRSNLYQYASDFPVYDMVDLYNLVYELKDLSLNKANKVLENIENAVIYNWATNSKSRGISIYFPYNGDTQDKTDLLRLYNSFDFLKNYNNFILNFNTIQTTSYKDFSFNTNKTDIELSKEEADFTLELTDEQKEGYAKATYLVFRDNKDGYFLPTYVGNDVKLNGNILSANIKNKQLKVMSINDSTETVLTLFEKEVNDEFIEYNTNVILEFIPLEDFSDFKMDNASMSIIYNKKTNETKIGGVFLSNKTTNAPGGIVAVDLNNYTHIVFASSKYKILDENGNYNENWESNGVIEGVEARIEENITFSRQDFDDGYDYYCVFRIYDVDNNYYYSKLIKMK